MARPGERAKHRRRCLVRRADTAELMGLEAQNRRGTSAGLSDDECLGEEVDGRGGDSRGESVGDCPLSRAGWNADRSRSTRARRRARGRAIYGVLDLWSAEQHAALSLA